MLHCPRGSLCTLKCSSLQRCSFRWRCFLFAVITVMRHLWTASAKRSRPPIFNLQALNMESGKQHGCILVGGSLWANLGSQLDIQMMTVRLQMGISCSKESPWVNVSPLD